MEGKAKEKIKKKKEAKTVGKFRAILSEFWWRRINKINIYAASYIRNVDYFNYLSHQFTMLF